MGVGFFDSGLMEMPHQPVQVPQRKKAVTGCLACGLDKAGAQSPRMPPTGYGKLGILAVAEAPGKTEDEENIQLIGEAGSLLRRVLFEEGGYDLDRDFRKTNAVCCRPPKNRAPTDREIECCRARLWKEIESFNPRVIVLLGGAAVRSFVGDRTDDKTPIGLWRGWTIPDQRARAWVVPSLHPSYVLRQNSQSAGRARPGEEQVLDVSDVLLRQDLRLALQLAKERREVPVVEEDIILCKDAKEACSLMDETLRKAPKYIAFDYETTGLKPERKGHRIVTCAISDARFRAYAFMMTPETSRKLSEVLLCKSIMKVAANRMFEERWTRVILGHRVVGWLWDVLQAAHDLDNRRGASDLKFQTYVNFGVLGYENKVSFLLKTPEDPKDADEHGDNTFNCIDHAPRSDLLHYNAQDALYTRALAAVQMQRIQERE